MSLVNDYRSDINMWDGAIISAVLNRVDSVSSMHGVMGLKEPRYDYARETAIHEKYAEAFEDAGIPRIHAHRVAAAIIDAGKAAVRNDQKASH